MFSLLHRVHLPVLTPLPPSHDMINRFSCNTMRYYRNGKMTSKCSLHIMWPGVKWPQEATYLKRRRNKYLKPQKIGSFGILFWCWKWELDLGNLELKYFIELSKAIEDYILALDISFTIPILIVWKTHKPSWAPKTHLVFNSAFGTHGHYLYTILSSIVILVNAIR